ncbi:unnamed protein product [Dicrocoelium dendriticum]|nr:unnamed protein product [Dicrocoelium dendriticum]
MSRHVGLLDQISDRCVYPVENPAQRNAFLRQLPQANVCQPFGCFPVSGSGHVTRWDLTEQSNILENAYLKYHEGLSSMEDEVYRQRMSSMRCLIDALKMVNEQHSQCVWQNGASDTLLTAAYVTKPMIRSLSSRIGLDAGKLDGASRQGTRYRYREEKSVAARIRPCFMDRCPTANHFKLNFLRAGDRSLDTMATKWRLLNSLPPYNFQLTEHDSHGVSAKPLGLRRHRIAHLRYTP